MRATVDCVMRELPPLGPFPAHAHPETDSTGARGERHRRGDKGPWSARIAREMLIRADLSHFGSGLAEWR